MACSEYADMRLRPIQAFYDGVSGGAWMSPFFLATMQFQQVNVEC